MPLEGPACADKSGQAFAACPQESPPSVGLYIAKILSIASDVRLMSVGSQGIISAVQGPS